MTSVVEPGRRAAPLAPEERRSAILRAVAPLVRDRGLAVTTRELAAAAGVAEGTLFRVYPDKLALVLDAVADGLAHALATDEAVAEILAVGTTAPLEERIARLLVLGRRRQAEAGRWLVVLHSIAAAARGGEGGAGGERFHEVAADMRARAGERSRAVRVALRTVLEPDAARMRVPLGVVVALVEAAATSAPAGGIPVPGVGGADRAQGREDAQDGGGDRGDAGAGAAGADAADADPELIADVLVHGVLARASGP